MRSAQECATRIGRGETDVIDLAGLGHGRGRHVDLTILSAIAWWLMSTDLNASCWTCRVPHPGSAPFLHLARSGVLTAALLRGTRIVDESNRPLDLATLSADHGKGQARLPLVDWEVMDELTEGEGLRIVPDLADPRRAPRRPVGHKFAYPWLAKLGLASAAISATGYQRFVSDADLVLMEIIDNVHRWSTASSAFAVVSTTRGSTDEGNCNRLHMVVADDGIGIPAAIRADLVALEAVHRASGETGDVDRMTDPEIVERLMRFAFGNRMLANHNGHGLNVAQVQAGKWVGSLDVLTIGVDGACFLRGSRGVNPAKFDAQDSLSFPGVRGTLIHILLQAREPAPLARGDQRPDEDRTLQIVGAASASA